MQKFFRASEMLLKALLMLGITLVSATSIYAAQFPITLNYNFNGMVHNGEAGSPDALNGYRSISDRGLVIDGGQNSFSDITSQSLLNYDIVDTAFNLDIVHIGNRNTVDSGNYEFDSTVNGDNRGIQPSWLTTVDQPGNSTTINPPIVLDSNSEIGILYNISNGGGDFDVTLSFSDLSSVTVTINGPDWYGPSNGQPDPPGDGVSFQQNLGIFSGSRYDSASPDDTLLVTEAIIDATEVQNDLGFNVSGRQLTGITVGNRNPSNPGYAIYAITVTGSFTSTSIPTMSQWGMIILSLILAGSALWMIRRRQAL